MSDELRCPETYLAKGFSRPARCRRTAGHEGDHTSWLGGCLWIDWPSTPTDERGKRGGER